jgi:NTP pyrophosphatase (non-canonical NTP hydrolase)
MISVGTSGRNGLNKQQPPLEGDTEMITEHDLQAFGYYDAVVHEAHKTPTEMVKEYSKVSGQKPDALLYVTLIEEEFDEWQHETLQIMDYRPQLEIKELADLLYVIYGYANARGWDVEEALRRVHKNNMGRMRQPDGTIKRRADGKIIRNSEYPKVALEDLVK